MEVDGGIHTLQLISHTRSQKLAEQVLTAPGCDPEGAVHQRRQEQHELLSTSQTPHTHTHDIYVRPKAHIVSLTHTHTCVCRKQGLMTGSVLCALTQLPPGHTLPIQQKTDLCAALAPPEYMYLPLSCSRCLPAFFPL